MIDKNKLLQLAKKDPSVTMTREGVPTCKINDGYVHSRYAPLREAERLVSEVLTLCPKYTLVILFGVGFGYHVELLEKAGFHHLILIEQDPKIWNYFNTIFKPESYYFTVDPEAPPEKLDAIFHELKIEKFHHIKTLFLRGAYQKERYKAFEQRLSRLMKVKLGDFSTRMFFEENWFNNMIVNIKNMDGAATLDTLIRKKTNLPVLLISAGPSLKQSLPSIKQAEKNMILIAVDTALLPLYEAEITPDFVYSLDSQVHNLADFSFISRNYLKNVTLIYDVVSHPSLPLNYPGKRVIANTAHLDVDVSGTPIILKHGLIRWLEQSSGLIFGDVETGGSVATSAFHLAYMLGTDTILLTGQDLAFSYNISHCPSTSHLYRLQPTLNRLNTLETAFLKVLAKRKVFPVKGLHGKVFTDFILDNYRGWFEESAKNIRRRDNIKLINAGAKGASIEHFEEVSLDKILNHLSSTNDSRQKKELKRLFLPEKQKIDKIKRLILSLENFVKTLSPDADLLSQIERTEFRFLSRYFLKEKTFYERTEEWDSDEVKRKIDRLLKHLTGRTCAE